MPFGSIQLTPGQNSVATPTLNTAGVNFANLIRYRLGLIEKLGGWLRYVNASMGSITRALHAWEDLLGNAWLAVGSLASLQVINNFAATDITPQTVTSNPAINFTTAAGGTTITVIDTGINNLTGFDSVFFNTPVSVGGITLYAGYQINFTPSADTYTINSIIPAVSSVNNTGTVPSFSVTLGSPTVTVTFANHGVAAGGKFVFPIATIVGGVTITGTKTVLTVIDQNTFTIQAPTVATSTTTGTMNGGNAQFVYSIAQGPGTSSSFGALGPIGQFAIGEGFARTVSNTSQTGLPITATDWTLDNWGEILLACPRGGQIWYWQPNAGFLSMLPVGTGPQVNNGIFVAMPAQILVAWGSVSTFGTGTTDSSQDKLIVRWSDQLNFTSWQVLATNQAGSFHIPTGSEIRGGIQGSNIALIFTDIDVWSMTYIGYPLVFGFNKIFSSGGLVGAHAVCEMYGSIYWMSYDNFYICSNGSVSVIPCTIWDNVFQNLNTSNLSKAVAAAHPDFGEIFFFFPSANGTGENDSYAKLSVSQGNIWDFGLMSRSAWQTRSILGPPIGADPNTMLLQQHELSYSADGANMDSFFETGYTAFGDGETFGTIDQFEPDMKWTTYNSSVPSASIAMTVTTVNYPNDTASMSETLTMTSTTEYQTCRVRGKQVKWRIESNDNTSWWRTGLVRFRFNPDGRR